MYPWENRDRIESSTRALAEGLGAFSERTIGADVLETIASHKLDLLDRAYNIALDKQSGRSYGDLANPFSDERLKSDTDMAYLDLIQYPKNGGLELPKLGVDFSLSLSPITSEGSNMEIQRYTPQPIDASRLEDAVQKPIGSWERYKNQHR